MNPEPEPDRGAMNALGFPRQTPGMLRDILRFVWMLPAVWAVEGKPAFSPHVGGEWWNRGVGTDPEREKTAAF